MSPEKQQLLAAAMPAHAFGGDAAFSPYPDVEIVCTARLILACTAGTHGMQSGQGILTMYTNLCVCVS